MADTENHCIEFRKECSYGNTDNFQHPDELMVTITLKEYRELVSSKATKESDISKLKNEYWEKEKEYQDKIQKLEQKLDKILLRAKEDEEED